MTDTDVFKVTQIAVAGNDEDTIALTSTTSKVQFWASGGNPVMRIASGGTNFTFFDDEIMELETPDLAGETLIFSTGGSVTVYVLETILDG